MPARAYLVFFQFRVRKIVSSVIGAMRRTGCEKEQVPQRNIEAEEDRCLPSASSLSFFSQKDIRRKKSVRFCGKSFCQSSFLFAIISFYLFYLLWCKYF